MTKRLDRLNASNSKGIAFQKLWQRNCESVEEALDSLIDAVAAIAAAQTAADNANAAAATADAAAAAAQDTADSITAASEIGDSFVTGATITATDAGADATITISAHTRHYPQPDGSTTNVSVNGGSLTAQVYSTHYFIYYDDAAHAGGAVTYHSTTSESTAAQLGDRHCVGDVTTPAALAADTSGAHVGPPGPGQLSSQ